MPLSRKEYARFYYAKNRIMLINKLKERRAKLKYSVIYHYSKGVNECACCQEKEIKFLCVDHIKGGGTQHRIKIGRSQLYLWLKRNNFPLGFQILCYNCNAAKGFYTKCPHQNKTE